jgi:hypothetical protein
MHFGGTDHSIWQAIAESLKIQDILGVSAKGGWMFCRGIRSLLVFQRGYFPFLQ